MLPHAAPCSHPHEAPPAPIDFLEKTIKFSWHSLAWGSPTYLRDCRRAPDLQCAPAWHRSARCHASPAHPHAPRKVQKARHSARGGLLAVSQPPALANGAGCHERQCINFERDAEMIGLTPVEPAASTLSRPSVECTARQEGEQLVYNHTVHLAGHCTSKTLCFDPGQGALVFWTLGHEYGGA